MYNIYIYTVQLRVIDYNNLSMSSCMTTRLVTIRTHMYFVDVCSMMAYVHKCVSFVHNVHINGTYLSDPFRENEWPPLPRYNMSTPHLSNRDLSMPSCQFHNLQLILIQISMGDA